MKNGQTIKVSVIEERLNIWLQQNSKEHREMFESLNNLKENHLEHLNQRIEKMEAKMYMAAGAIAIATMALQLLK